MNNTHTLLKKLTLFPLSTQISILSPCESIYWVGYMSTAFKSPSDVSDTFILFILYILTQWSFNVFGSARILSQIALKCCVFSSIAFDEINSILKLGFCSLAGLTYSDVSEMWFLPVLNTLQTNCLTVRPIPSIAPRNFAFKFDFPRMKIWN